jgi:stage II sporulation protein AA (anti-sigma F factor antagonist)
MTIRNLSDNVILVVLPMDPKLRDELAAVNELVSNEGTRHVILDFSHVEILTSSSISNLMLLHNLLSERGRELILCAVSPPTKGIFRTAGLDAVFHFANSQSAALTAIKHAEQHEPVRSGPKSADPSVSD